MENLTAQVSAVVGTSALLYYITAPRKHQNEDIVLTPWEEHSTIAQTRKIRSKFQKRRRRQQAPPPAAVEYDVFQRRQTSSLSDDGSAASSGNDSAGQLPVATVAIMEE